MKIDILEGVELSKLNLKKDDVILMTVDLDIFDIEAAYDIFKIISKEFSENKVVCTFKGVEIKN